MANGKTFEVGTVVQLKSGGPLMTIINVTTDAKGRPSFECKWFVGETKPETDFFPAEAIKAVEV